MFTPRRIKIPTQLNGGQSSDIIQRDLHNQIAIMIFGEPRSNMNESLAIKISNFAQEIADTTVPSEA